MKTMETRMEEMEKAIEEIRAVLGMTDSPATPEPQKNTGLTLKQKVTNLIHEIGVPAHIKGYGYVREAILMTIKNPGVINSITYRVYPQIAETFQTTPSRVERAIRHAIEVAWTNGDMDTLTGMFGYTISNSKGKPTNSQFIALIADRFMIEDESNEVD